MVKDSVGSERVKDPSQPSRRRYQSEIDTVGRCGKLVLHEQAKTVGVDRGKTSQVDPNRSALVCQLPKHCV